MVLLTTGTDRAQGISEADTCAQRLEIRGEIRGGKAVKVSLAVRVEPDPRFVFEVDGASLHGDAFHGLAEDGP